MWDAIWAFITNPIVFSALTILARNLFGWFVNSMKDGKIQDYELKQLGQTYGIVLGLAFFTFLGLNVVIEVGPEEAVLVAALLDVLRSFLKK